MKTLFAGLAVSMLALGIPGAAHADGSTYEGGCDVSNLRESTPGEWDGVIRLIVFAKGGSTPNTSSVTALCELLINGVSQGTVLGPVSGTGFVATAGPIEFSASSTDTVTVCDHVSIAGGAEVVMCHNLTLVDSTPHGVTACSDGIDNDGDGRTDYPADPDCSDPLDNDESTTSPTSCSTVAGVVVCASYTTGSVIDAYTVYGPTSAPTQVAGYVARYEFDTPNGGTVSLPCVVLLAGAAGVDPCATAGGRPAERILTLVDQPVDAPTTALTTPLVHVCNATLVLTVNNLGVNSQPAYTIC